jgi:hypothetical protein
MRRIITVLPLSLMLFLFASTVLAASPKVDKQQCIDVKSKIREIEARMRNGYSASQGIRLEARLRKLKDKRYRVCR